MAGTRLTTAEHRRNPSPDGLIPLTRNEIATLFASLIIGPPGSTRHRLRWSSWRRRHGAVACLLDRVA